MVDSKLASSSISNLSPELLLLQQNNLYSTFPFVSTSLQANFNSLNTATQQNNPPGSLHHLPFAQSSLTQKPPIVFNQTMRQIGQIGQIASKSIILAPKPQYTGAGLEVIQQSITESKKRSFDESQSLASSSDDGGKRGRKSAGNKWQREALAQRSEAGSSSGQANQAMAFRLFLKDEQSKGVVSLENVDESSDPKLNPLGLKMWEVHNVDQWWKDVHSWFEDNPERFSLRAFFMMLRRLGYKPLNHAPAPATSGLDYGLRNRFVKKHGYVYDKDVFEKYQRRRGLKKLPFRPATGIDDAAEFKRGCGQREGNSE
ncbi:hypothetical protein GUITHDRAFT_139171 [Guillardia theta CCMP2712]|uniref:Uncharacterized protein n=1 Tax=Guillardia theta (strain CCMP2712) TaxID=905079 RepID=L1JAB7_GUITC|nr:hypothetical protein GUITHDRAFT_139171 [Guillardia theta CCMP2712]EKX45257.1 hypothetical protein GUITHDRAFT_139171 [Guillardia theta CCMP2712]|eukprot:XP_005832237.1 hypothetical protein GUITHDRAFT_139171 [Guillardia theta CCMP2712]